MMESSRKEKYEEGIDVEHKKFVKFECLEETLKEDLRPDDKVIDGTWVRKFKASGGLPRCRMTTRGFKQTDGVHYDSTDVAAPVICDITIQICMILCIMANWLAWIVDVEGELLQGSFQNGE